MSEHDDLQERYRQARREDMAAEDKVMDAVRGAVKDTAWAAPNGTMVDCVTIMLFCDEDGDYAVTWMSSGSDEQAEGMMRKVLRQLALIEDVELRYRSRRRDEDDG